MIVEQTETTYAVCLTRKVAEPSDFVELIADSTTRPAFYWEHPESGEAVAGLGAAVEIRCSGPHRFAEASRRAVDELRKVGRGGVEGPGPLVLGGFGFSDEDASGRQWREFPSVRLFIPELTWIRTGGQCWEISVSGTAGGSLNGDNGRGTPPYELASESGERQVPASNWESRVEEALRLLHDGSLRKVVLARSKHLDPGAVVCAADAARVLRDSRPQCFTYWVRGGETEFVGSTPELLARVDGSAVQTVALAGSAPRDPDHRRDRENAARLQGCEKNRSEHDIVVQEVKGKLTDVCGSLDCPETPEVKAFPEAYHLATPISGRLARRLTAIEVAGLLHPTSAVCGIPSSLAASLIAKGGEERGWYSGLVGWMRADGDGSFAVALRSGLLDGEAATVWAGAGIVEASDPRAEAEEIESKMGALASVLERR